MSKEDRQRYRESWKLYNDYFNTIESAEKKATEEGLAKGQASDFIADITGLTIEEIEAL